VALGIFKKEEKTHDKLPPSKAQQRASKLDNSALYGWMDNSIMSLGASFDAWRFKDAPASEVNDCIEALQTIWKELESRKQ
jgi:hypothetical protein